jgi:nitrogen fixation/metabolism regulation signal transduction histidine kinase
MSKIYIKYFLIGNLDTNKPITEYSTKAIDSTEKKNAGQIFKKLSKVQERKNEERNIISGNGNKYYFITYNPNILFLVYVDEEYPERLVFQMLDEVKNEGILSMINNSTQELDPNGRQKLKEVIEKYQDKDNLDRIGAIQNDVNEVKVEVKKNIDKMVENVEDVQKLEEKSNLLKDASKDYEKNSEELKRITCWQNFKLWIILIIIVLLLVGFILYFIFS